MKQKFLAGLLVILVTGISFSQTTPKEPVDTTAIRKIWNEGTENSQAMNLLHYLTDVCGPRLTGSPQYTKAANWATQKMKEWGMTNVHLDGLGPFGRGWTLRRYTAHATQPDIFPLLSYPKAWSPATKGTVQGEAILFDAKTDSAIETYRGKLKGKFILIGNERKMEPLFEPRASRKADSTLLEMANSDISTFRRFRRGPLTPEARQNAVLEYKKMKLLEEEGAHAILTPSRGDGGTIFVQQANVTIHPDTPFARRPRVWDTKAPSMLPQVAVAAEHYNRLVRVLKNGERVRMEMNLDVNFHKADSVYNIIGEIRGTEFPDEVVMVGGHFDSWHGGTGATDNATGSVVALEAMRILRALDLKPRRTIRIGLWAGEEQGLLGSSSYVKKHFGERQDTASPVILKPAGEKFSVYFNDDNGGGRFRGIYMQSNPAVQPIFRAWLSAAGDRAAQTLTLRNTGSTDHVPFDQIGLPAFQFIQDDIEYGSMTWHSTMDLYDRVIEKDLQQSAVIMAIFAYHAAMRDELMPRK